MLKRLSMEVRTLLTVSIQQSLRIKAGRQEGRDGGTDNLRDAGRDGSMDGRRITGRGARHNMTIFT